MGKIRDAIKFDGKWRNYQARVLKNADKYLQDKRVHIVAAPGSGKTTLGIELIGRMDAPCLILTPSITIREQWLNRIKTGFGVPEEMISNDIRNASDITAITYQSLHSCVKKLKSTEEDEMGNKEEKDYSGFDFYGEIKKRGIKTLCLDEAHHLRSEWQKALEEVVKELKECTIISLTATPPYDSTPQQWKRYSDLCGPIDEEITVPELVKEGSLCAHQDYVYFSLPDEEQKADIQKFKTEAQDMGEYLSGNEMFKNSIRSHTSVLKPDECTEIFLENPRYLKALALYFKAMNVPYKNEMLVEIPPQEKFDLADLEIILQMFLYDDRDNYKCNDEFREHIEAVLKAHGLIHGGKVELLKNSEIEKLLITGIGKLESIRKITTAEFFNLKENLRMLILTDYIRGEFSDKIGTSEEITEMGVVPIFEAVRRLCAEENGLSDDELRPAALSGSVVIVPVRTIPMLEEMAEKNGQKISSEKIGETPYAKISVSGSGPRATVYLTELLGRGEIRVLIGTKSLLGEGWDSPCINSLILASFVGSYMLSNQMRGRAIRAMRDNPKKASNIWHLICMQPEGVASSTEEDEDTTDDFATLERRFKGFLGVNYSEEIIENGLSRLTDIKPPYTEEGIATINKNMLQRAKERPQLYDKWHRVLNNMKEMDLADEAGINVDRVMPKDVRKKAITNRNVKTGATAAVGAAAVVLLATGNIIPGLIALGAGGILGATAIKANKNAKCYTDEAIYMKCVGEGILESLKKAGQCTSNDLKVDADQDKESNVCYVYLLGGTEREKGVFADTCQEFFANIQNQRYIMKIILPNTTKEVYFCVPELFATKKEDAEMFSGLMSKWIGRSELIYTRGEQGKKKHLKAKINSLSGENIRETVRIKRLKEV